MSVAPRYDTYPVDPTALARVRGNAPVHIKRSLLQILGTQTPAELFGGTLAQQLQIVEVNLVPSTHEPERVAGQVIWEVVVSENLLDARGSLDVGCFALFLDIWGTFPMIVHGMHHRPRGDNIGVSQAMQFTFHDTGATRLGARIRGDATSLAVGGRTLSARCEMRDVDTGRLLCSGVHLKMSPSIPKL
ncbi:hypothetical protein EXIGLDRAFT_727366 [Exidia glandulosa HHB12029]|uniref:Thioesterase domain-containing protein n=1 Tax=Exidia glandulosa HHB12029 TaxID=1314781 RepID=A0A165M1V2_EXIGL|nr:hypothetical protein EXIGLDRAFT_727366 [Exidia glandulosa HHB12029]